MRGISQNQVTSDENINAKLDTLAMDIKRMYLSNDTLAHSSAAHMDRGHYLQEDFVTHLKIIKKNQITCITFTFT